MAVRPSKVNKLPVPAGAREREMPTLRTDRAAPLDITTLTPYASLRAPVYPSFGVPAQPSPGLPATLKTRGEKRIQKNAVKKSLPAADEFTQHSPTLSQSTGTETNSSPAPALAGVSALLSISAFCLFRHRAKRISYWAGRNPWKSRALIVAAQVGATFSALALGDYLAVHSIAVSEAAKYSAVAAFGSAFILYPSSTSKYLSRKICDTVLLTSSAVMMLYAGNHYMIPELQADHSPRYTVASTSLTDAGIPLLAKRKISARKAVLQDAPREKSTTEKILLTILATALFAAALYATGALACTIACSGSEGSAWAVLLIGAAGFTFLFVRALRSIYRKRDKRTESA